MISRGEKLILFLFSLSFILLVCRVMGGKISWWGVTAPLWIPVVLFVGVFVAAAVADAVRLIVTTHRTKRAIRKD